MADKYASFMDHVLAARSGGDRLIQVAFVCGVALGLLFLFDRLVERLSPKVTKHAEAITTSRNVLRLRRAETFIGLGLTIFRVLIVVAALYVIWHLGNPSSGPLALIGVGSAVVILASATVVPLLRDITYGFIMIAEHWYGVGDHVVFEPFSGSGGVVERLTLRSTKLRSVNGEAIWVHHQHIQAARITAAVAHPLIVETFVNDPEAGRRVIEDTIKLIPAGPTTMSQPLEITEIKQVDDAIWRITAVCEITPFREWVIEDFTVAVIRKTDSLAAEATGRPPCIVHGPIVYYADVTAQKRYRRSATVRQRLRSAARKPTPVREPASADEQVPAEK